MVKNIRGREVDLELKDSEELLEYSCRNPVILPGILCSLIGIILFSETIYYWQIGAIGIIYGIGILLTSFFQIYLGVRFLFILKREYIFVTTQRVAYQKMNAFGKQEYKVISILLSDVCGVHFYKSTVMFNTGKISGDVLLRLKSKKTYLLPSMYEGEYIAETISKELPKISQEN